MIDFSKPGWLIDANKVRTKVNFEYVDNTWCMINGKTIAMKFGYTNPTYVYLYYRLEKNEFLLYDKLFHKIIKHNNRMRREQEEAEENDNTAARISDDDHESDDDADAVDPTNFNEFKVIVSHALTTTNQVFVSIFVILSLSSFIL
jgi:hypothetical protein